MAARHAFTNLQERLAKNSESAAEELLQRYAPDLVRLANRQRPHHLQAKFEGEDVVQSVLGSFFERYREERFELTSWDSLWALLVRITLRKCGRTATFWNAARRDAAREISLESAQEQSSGQAWQAYEPKVEDAVALRETIESICEHLTPTQQTIFLMELEGYTAAEIGKHVGRSLRTVRRTLAEIRGGLARFSHRALSADLGTTMQLLDERTRKREEIIERFEQAWLEGQRMDLRQFLPGRSSENEDLLRELLHIDVEWRLAVGEVVRIEDYEWALQAASDRLQAELAAAIDAMDVAGDPAAGL